MITVRNIQDATCRTFGITRDELLADCRQRRFARPRQIAMYLARSITGASWSNLGREFCRDHTTVLHANEFVRDELINDPYSRGAIAEIREDLVCTQPAPGARTSEQEMRRAWRASAKLTRVSGSAF